MPVVTLSRRWPASAGCTGSSRPMTSRIRAVTALRARSDWSPSRRGCPPGAAAAASSRSRASRSARARAARSGSFQLSASAMSSPRLASRARTCRRAVASSTSSAPIRRSASPAWPAPAAAIRSAAGTWRPGTASSTARSDRPLASRMRAVTPP